ncbi:MAG: hypothetical protein AB7V56_03575 [Candidatus Nitrosocosmicus sp.]
MIASIAIVVALDLFASPLVAADDVFATHKKANKAKQSISQSQSSSQNAGCVTGGTTFLSCNNLGFQHQKNTGNNALGQSGRGGNFTDQSISQSQFSNKTSNVDSGGNTVGSGNNFNSQSQTNTRNNAAAQQG